MDLIKKRMNIQITNLDSKVTDEQLRSLFDSYGEVSFAQIQYDAFTGASRGFGYVEMTDEASGQKAIAELNGSILSGCNISVSETAPKPVQKGSYKVGNGSVTTFRFRKNK